MVQASGLNSEQTSHATMHGTVYATMHGNFFHAGLSFVGGGQ